MRDVICGVNVTNGLQGCKNRRRRDNKNRRVAADKNMYVS